MRTLVLYSSALGTTKRYATWLREALEADITRANARRKSAQDYDLIIICSPTFLGRIRLLSYMKDRWSAIRDKRLILVAVGMSPPDSPASRKTYQSIPPEIQARIVYFQLPGRIGPAGKDRVKQENLRPVLQYIRSIGA